jgi:hypothetical protein
VRQRARQLSTWLRTEIGAVSFRDPIYLLVFVIVLIILVVLVINLLDRV